tara:strand:+ start:11087 stop:11224 length:138 start_codon:yes stop_codon:yes gene_type:complete
MYHHALTIDSTLVGRGVNKPVPKPIFSISIFLAAWHVGIGHYPIP